MDDENANVIEELRQVRKALAFLSYSLWSVGALLTIRHQPSSPGETPARVDLDSPEGRKIGVDALLGFAALTKIAMDEWASPTSSLPIPPWKM
ncbi:MAG: hypothetical protein ACLQOO_21810 [Terriglobia bacterium]